MKTLVMTLALLFVLCATTSAQNPELPDDAWGLIPKTAIIKDFLDTTMKPRGEAIEKAGTNAFQRGDSVTCLASVIGLTVIGAVGGYAKSYGLFCDLAEICPDDMVILGLSLNLEWLKQERLTLDNLWFLLDAPPTPEFAYQLTRLESETDSLIQMLQTITPPAVKTEMPEQLR